MCCIWAIGEQTTDAMQSLPPSFSCTGESGWDLLNQYFLIQQWGAKSWIGSGNFYPHCIRCTCLNSFIELQNWNCKKWKNWNRSNLEHAELFAEGIAVVKVYLSWLQIVFVQIDKWICWNSKDLPVLKAGKWPWTWTWWWRRDAALVKMWSLFDQYLFPQCWNNTHCVTHAIPLVKRSLSKGCFQRKDPKKENKKQSISVLGRWISNQNNIFLILHFC